MTERTRRLIVALLVLGALLSTLSSAAVIVQRQIRLRGALNGLPDADLPPRPPVLGVNVELTQYDAEELEENLDLIAATGFVWLRQVFNWSEVEPQPGEYDWSAYDRIVEEVATRDLQMVAVLWRSPAWAASVPTAPPGDLDAFAAFAAALAERYGDRIDVYQVWDEPNLSSGWGGQPVSPVGYAALLEAAYQAIHAADSDALVLTAGLAPTVETGPDNLSDVLFLHSLYENGAEQFFDGVAGKPYGHDTGPDDRRINPNLLNFSRFVLLREEMERHGDHSRPLWASHFGWNAPSGTQSAWTLVAYQRALTEWPWSGALILDNWQPDTLSDDPGWEFALRDRSGTLTPTAQAVGEHAALFNTALWPGVHPAATPLAAYNGEWEFSELGADFGQRGDSVVDVPFVGDSLSVLVRRDNYRAYLYVEVDGQPPDILPRDERGAYLVLTSPDYRPHTEVLTIASGYGDGKQHLAHIEAERGWDQWALIGFVVGSHVDTTASDLAATAMIILAVVLVGLVIRTGRGLAWPVSPQRLASSLVSRLGDGLHFALSAAAALAIWLGAALTWGGLIPNLIRRLGDGPSLLITILTAGIFYFSPWLLLTIAALIVLFLLIYAKPSIGLALMMFFAPYYLLPRPLFDRAFSMVEVISLLTLAAWGIHTVAARREAGWPTLARLWQQMTDLDRAVALFVAISVISLGWAELLGVAITELRQMILEPVVVYLVLRTMSLTRRERWRIVDLLILTGVIVAVIGFYQFATGVNIVTAEEGARRLRSVYGSPNSAALFLGRLFPITAAVVLIGGTRQRRWLYGAAGVLIAAATALTLSKGGLLLGLPAGIALVVILWAGRRGLLAVIAGAVFELLSLIPLSRIPRFSGLLNFGSGTSTSFFRLQLWQSTLRLLRDHPLTGVGLDQFLYQYRGRYILPAAWQQPDLSHPHNVLLNYWVRLGLFGLIAGVWMQVAFWRLAWKAQSSLKEGDVGTRAIVVGLMGGMAAFIAHGLVDQVHFAIDLSCIFFMTLGLMHQLGKEVPNGRSDDQQPDSAVGRG